MTIFETTDDRLTFLVTIPVREGCGESSETDILGSETGSERKTKSSERSMETKDLIIDITSVPFSQDDYNISY